jgi:hypothetical protein
MASYKIDLLTQTNLNEITLSPSLIDQRGAETGQVFEYESGGAIDHSATMLGYNF